MPFCHFSNIPTAKIAAILKYSLLSTLILTDFQRGYSQDSLLSFSYQFELPGVLLETSGLEYDANYGLWSHNDSGNDPILYQLNPSDGTITHSCYLNGVSNRDWEDLAMSETHLLIGEFGNNNGSSMELQIIRVPLTALSQDTIEASQIDTIGFSYADQVDFTPNQNATAYDCESMVVAGDSLFLFTKNWIQQYTVLYALPLTVADTAYDLNPIDTFNTQGLITAADLGPDGKTLVLLGQESIPNLGIFIWTFWDFPGHEWFNGQAKRHTLGNFLNLGQMEGICFTDSLSGYISNERFSIAVPPVLIPQALHHLQLGAAELNTSIIIEGYPQLHWYPNPVQDYVNLELKGVWAYEVFNTQGQILLKGHSQGELQKIELRSLAAGIYYLRFNQQDQSHSIRIVKQ